MPINLSVDVHNATLGDLQALVNAARVAGCTDHCPVQLEDTTLSVQAEDTSAPQDKARHNVGGEPGAGNADNTGNNAAHWMQDMPRFDRPASPFPQEAIRSVMDILTGRQEPPRRDY